MAEGQRVDKAAAKDVSLAAVQQTDTGGVLTVRVGALEHAIPVSHVREVARVGRIARVPRVPVAIRGVTTLRGAVLPVLDLGQRLGGQPTDVNARQARLVAVTRSENEEPVALLVDDVLGLVDARELTEGVRVLDLDEVLDLDPLSSGER